MRVYKRSLATDRALAQPAPGSTALPAGLSAASLWAALSSEPFTGVWIASMDARILCMNDYAARVLHGPDANGADYAGRNLSDLHSPHWIEEHLAVLRRVLLLGKPVLVRTIWHGWQLMSWVSNIEAAPNDEEQGSAGWSGPRPARFLVITRRQPSNGYGDSAEFAGRYEIIDSEAMHLGPMEVLTPRELEVLSLIGQGMSNREIAQALFRSVKTVDNHRTSIMTKLSSRDRLKLALIARRAGLTLKDAGKARR